MKENKETISKKELNKAIDTSNIMVKWNPDPKGYFTIKPIFNKNRVFVRYYDPQDRLKHTFSGIITLRLIQEIIERKLISRLDHAAYLGKEIEKAIIALKNRLNYIQDNDLQLKEKEANGKE